MTSTGTGFHTMLRYLDGTEEPVAGVLRSGCASGTTTPMITTGRFDTATAAVPVARTRWQPLHPRRSRPLRIWSVTPGKPHVGQPSNGPMPAL